MSAELKQIPVAQISDHPKNPRIVFREDVIDAIAANIEFEWPQQHALHVRPLDNCFQLISGHHRIRAAQKAELETVWCWVETMDDEAAYMALATANNQGELSPLEIGLHALNCEQLSKGGRGKKGGVAAYAARIGQKQPNVSIYRKAAIVFDDIKPISQYIGLLDKAKHLASIHALPKELWRLAVDTMLANKLSVAETEERVVAPIRELSVPERHADWLPVVELAQRILSNPDFSSGRVFRLVSCADSVISWLEEKAIDASEFKEWLKDNSGGDAWIEKCIYQWREEFEAKLEAEESAATENWLLGQWEDHISNLDDGSVSLILTDPPYGMDYQSGRRSEAHEKIAGDTDARTAAENLLSFLDQVQPKLADKGHAFIFCRHELEHALAAELSQFSFTVRSRIVWVKNNHGAGDLKAAYAPKYERILHATWGDARLFNRRPDVIACAKVDTGDHPTQKPIELLQGLIEDTTVEGNLVVDPYGGAASTAVAATKCNRRFWSCELEEAYHQNGKERLKHV